MSIEKIDANFCNGCRLCMDSCPMDVFRLDTLVTDRGEFPLCRQSCPAGVDMRTYIYLLKEGLFDEALKVLREALPFPAITGRVCPHPCESECARREVDEEVNINALERFVSDFGLNEKAQPAKLIYASEVAVVGSGPAGLACAYFLTMMGYPVTIFEAMSEPGGMLRSCIPEYRLPGQIVDSQVSYIKSMGITFKTGITVGNDVTFAELRKKYQVVFLAIGNQLSKKIELPGVDLKGVHWGLDFLRQAKIKHQTAVGDNVVVVGGGNVAVDVALTALRLGAKKVQIVCLESAENMPAFTEEVQQATEEGIVINTSWGPKRILGSGGKVTGLELVQCLSVINPDGVFNPSFNEQSIRTIESDMVVLAIGQVPNLSHIPGDIKVTNRDTIEVNPLTLETSQGGIFAGGDVVSGASSVVDSIAAGKCASISIDRFLRGMDVSAERELRPKRVKKSPKEGITTMARQQTPLIPVSQRKLNFAEIKAGFNYDMGNLEAQRCMTCGSRAVIRYADDCQLCLFCERDCPQKAIYVSPDRKVSPMVAWA